MAKAGRKRKQGKRYPGGKRVPDLRVIKGNDRAEERKQDYGTHATTALGRAYVKGLLGDGVEAEARYTAAKRFMRIAGHLFPGSGYRCALDNSPRGRIAASEDNHERDLHDQQWFMDRSAALETARLRPALNLLILDLYHDYDPPFLHRLLKGGKDPIDRAMLARCIKALDIIAPEQDRPRILVEHY